LPAPRSRRVLRGRETEIAHQLARAVEAREVPDLGQHDDGARELDPTQRPDRLDRGIPPPACDRLVELPLQTLQPLGLMVRSVFLDASLNRKRTDEPD
jgi:hypothetical protein